MSDPNNQGNMQGPGQSPDGAQRPRRNFPLLLLFLGLITAVILVFSKPAKDAEITSVDELNEWIMEKDEPWVNELTITDMKSVRGTFRDIDATRHFKHTKFEIPYTGTGLTNTLTGEQVNANEIVIGPIDDPGYGAGGIDGHLPGLRDRYGRVRGADI